MPPPSSSRCTSLRSSLSRIQGLEADLKKAVDVFARDGGEANLASCHRIRTVLEEAMTALEKELGDPELEAALRLKRIVHARKKNPDGSFAEGTEKQEKELSLREQYDSQVATLRSLEVPVLDADGDPTGTMRKLLQEKEGRLFITGIDRKEYLLPSYEDILEKMASPKEKKELLLKKAEQGFTRLQITPFALPLKELIAAYKETILRAHKEGRLHDTEGAAGKGFDDLDTDKPVEEWKEHSGADESGALVYHPQQFTKENHGGKTKEEILQATEGDPASLPFPGFDILLLEENQTIPRVNKGETKGGRTQPEAGRQPKDYLADLRQATTDPSSPFHGESGLTPEDWLLQAIASLESGEGQIDNWENGKDSISYNLGGFFRAAGGVPGAYWYRGSRQAYLGGIAPGDADGNGGCRFAART